MYIYVEPTTMVMSLLLSYAAITQLLYNLAYVVLRRKLRNNDEEDYDDNDDIGGDDDYN